VNHNLSTINGQRPIFPLYHAVSDKPLPHLDRLLNVRSVAAFEKDIQFFVEHYQPISTIDLIENANKLDSKSVCVTFDGGLREFKENAWPILKKYKVPVTLFVNPSFIDNAELFYKFKLNLILNAINSNPELDRKALKDKLPDNLTPKDLFSLDLKSVSYSDSTFLNDIAPLVGVDIRRYLQRKKPYLTLRELKDLQYEGVTIGVHSMDHPPFGDLDDVGRAQQIRESINWAKETLHVKHSLFSFPFSDRGLDEMFFRKIYNHIGFDLDLTFGSLGLRKEKIAKHYQRISMESGSGSAESVLKREKRKALLRSALLSNAVKR
jgi:peptidoglycan/xylan/chitin deacetylase (PgdA/CDA1 family)